MEKLYKLYANRGQHASWQAADSWHPGYPIYQRVQSVSAIFRLTRWVQVSSDQMMVCKTTLYVMGRW